MDPQKLLAASLYSMAKAFVLAGAQPTKALMYASFVLIEDTYGRGKLEQLGLSPTTARYHRKNIRDLDLAALEDPESQQEIKMQAAAFIQDIERLMKDARFTRHLEEMEKIAGEE